MSREDRNGSELWNRTEKGGTKQRGGNEMAQDGTGRCGTGRNGTEEERDGT